EWEYKQWNLFYIINAIGIQLFLKHGLQYRSNQKQLRLRMLRQSIGEEFIEWADLYYSSDFENDKKDLGHLNIKIDKQVVFKDFREMCPSSSKWIQTKDLKKKIRIYCEYRGLQFNPGGDKDGRIKSNGIEYILVGESDFKTDANGNNSSDNQPEGTLPF
ncbi:MAG: hypothetical protein ABIV51_12540, partial [Saprospiraceae bacterium]